MPTRIGVTCEYRTQVSSAGLETTRMTVSGRFCDVIARAGALPVIIPITEDSATLLAVLQELDGVILSGGDDVPPDRYGAAPNPATVAMHARRFAVDSRLAQFVDEHEIPLLAVCGGVHEWNVHRGGTLHQHLPDIDASPTVRHRDDKEYTYHPVRLAPDSLIRAILKAEQLPVNSMHHQGIATLGADLVATAWADDGLVEAAEDPRRRFCLAVQWHPEDMPDDPLQQQIIATLVAAARG